MTRNQRQRDAPVSPGHGQDLAAVCFRKSAYSSEAFARKVASRCEEERGDVLRPYLCPHCYRWHLTKTERREH